MYIDPSLRRRSTDEALLRSILSENGVKKPCLQQQNEFSHHINGENSSSCGCAGNCSRANTKNGVYDRHLGIVYSPVQCWQKLYDLETGLTRGTIFAELDLPFEPSSSKGGNCCG